MTAHPTLTQLLAHLRRYDADCGAHLDGCPACAEALVALATERDALLDPPLPPVADADADRLIAAALVHLPVAEPTIAWRQRSRLRLVAQWAAIFLVGASAGAYAMTLAFPELQTRVAEAVARMGAPAAPAPEVLPDAPAPTSPPRRPRRPTPAPEAPVEAPVDAPPEVAPVLPAPVSSRDTLFREAADALARGEPDVARALLEILVELHPETDVQTLLLVERGLRLRLTDAPAAADAYRAALARDPEGGLADDLRGWLCELGEGHCE